MHDGNKGRIVVIGGSGIRDSPIFKNLEWKLSQKIYENGRGGTGLVEYMINDDVIFIPRHGAEYRIYAPSVTQYAANLILAKKLGATTVIATSAVGSLRDEIKVGSLVIADDYIDESGRNDNLYGRDLVIHANPIPPFSEQLRSILIDTVQNYTSKFNGIHTSAIYVCIPGDRFGTRAEGLRRAQYADIVGMTVCPEAAMALQLGLHYAVVAFPVDVNLDANHHGGTVQVMKQLSSSDKVPAYIAEVVQKAKQFAKNPPPLPQLQGNIIASQNIDAIPNEHLRAIAFELKEKYCS